MLLLTVKPLKPTIMKKKESAEKGSHENIESDFDESKIYQIYNMSLDGTKENIEWHKRASE